MDRTEVPGQSLDVVRQARVVPRRRSGSKSVRYNGVLNGFEEKRIVGRADQARLERYGAREGDAR
jgi:hypothetical protein